MNSGQTPTLRERILAPAREGEPPSYIELSQRPDVQARWQEYLATKWEAWAKEHRRWKSVQQVYGNLFSIYQQQKRLGESFELRIGLGLLSWQTPTGERIYRHIIAGQANINFDANRGVISVSAAAEGAKLTLEHVRHQLRQRLLRKPSPSLFQNPHCHPDNQTSFHQTKWNCRPKRSKRNQAAWT